MAAGPLDASCLTSGALVWRDGAGATRVSAIVQVAYALDPGGLAAVAPPVPIAIADMVPVKPHAEVVVTGRVAPERQGALRQIVGFAVARGAEVLVCKRLVAVGDRSSPDGPPAPLRPMPLGYELTWGGPGDPENPAGRGLAPGTPLPSLIDPDAPRRPVGLGPLPAGWPARAALLPAGLTEERLHERPLALPSGFDTRFFQRAPQDQWTAPLRGGERLLLWGLSEGPGPMECRLPALHAFARVEAEGFGARPVALVGDTLWIDADRGLAIVTFRGSIEVSKRSRPALESEGAWAVLAGLAPCADVEALVAAPRGWPPSRAASAQVPRPSPTVDSVTIVDESGFTAGSVAWSWDPPKVRRTVVVKGTFDIAPDGGPVTLASAQELIGGDVLASDAPDAELREASDRAPIKLEADVLIRGTAHAAPGKTTALVSLTLGSLRARVVALPPRAWDASGIPRSTGPFAPVPLRWASAFGGPGFAPNPAGTGFVKGSPPPLLEDPDRLMRTHADRPRPSLPAPIAAGWEARRALTGSFDRTWQRERWPYFPADFDRAYFQVAPAPLRMPYPAGDEAFRVDGVRPGGGAVAGALPGQRPRAFVVSDAAEPVEIPLHLDTVTFDTDELRVFLVWRGAFDPERAGARVVVLRDSVRAPRPHDEIAALLVLRAAEAGGPGARAVRGEGARAGSASRPGRSYALADVLSRADRGARATAGVFAAAAASRAAARGMPPPPVPAPRTRAEVEALLTFGRDLQALDLSDADLSGMDLSGCDLRGAILARANLSGTRLAGANLEGVSLARAEAPASIWDGANLARADLTGARLAGASLLGATLTFARLADVSLDGARMAGVSAEGASFVRASLARVEAEGATLVKADFSGATLEGAVLRKAVLDDAKLYEARAAKAVFDEASLADARFEQAALEGASFRDVKAAGAVWECADLSGAVLQNADVTGAVFAGARLGRADLRAVLGRGALFREADLTGARLDGADLMGACFESACLRGASLRGASLYRAETWLADLEGADLTGALLAATKLAD